jgi:hypothetical protein
MMYVYKFIDPWQCFRHAIIIIQQQQQRCMSRSSEEEWIFGTPPAPAATKYASIWLLQ